MEEKISVEELVSLVNKSDLDPVIKDILVRDIQKEGVSDFLFVQVLAYCDKTIETLKQKMKTGDAV